MVLASCTTFSVETSEPESTKKAIEEVKKPDAYYLVPCRKPDELTSDKLDAIIFMYEEIMIDYSECYHRHNGLINQVK